MITCQLCNREFEQITGNHLKHIHGISYDDYVSRFPNAPTMDEELRRSISEKVTALKLGNTYALGHICSEETKRKISEAHILRLSDPVERQRIADSLTLYYQSPEYTGKVFTEEGRKAISKTHTGKVSSPDALRLMSEAARRRWEDPEYQRHQMESWHRRPTQPELNVQDTLVKYFPGEWKYVGNGQVWIGRRNPDFINVNGKKQVIEVFGVFWHNEDEVEELTAHYKGFGFDCLIIWEYDTYNESSIVSNIKNM